YFTHFRGGRSSEGRLVVLLGPREMSDLSPQSGLKRTLDQVAVTNRDSSSLFPKTLVDRNGRPPDGGLRCAGRFVLRPLVLGVRRERPTLEGEDDAQARLWSGQDCQGTRPRNAGKRARPRRPGDRINGRLCCDAYVRFWHETAVLCVPANVCSWGKSGR